MQYEVVARSAAVPAGCVLKLSDDQVRRRRRHLEEVKSEGWRVVSEGVVFKHGETFELVSGHVDEKRGDLRAIGQPSPAEANEKKREAARSAGKKRRAAGSKSSGGKAKADANSKAAGGASAPAETGAEDERLPLGSETGDAA